MSTNFDLEIDLSRLDFDTYHIELHTRAPGGKVPMRPLRGRLQLDFERLQVLFPDPESYGSALTQSLFGDPDRRDYFLQSRELARAAGLPVRLLLTMDPSHVKLVGLRWETLRDPLDGSWLLGEKNTRLFRLIRSSDWTSAPPLKAATGRALAVVSCPKDLPGYAPWSVGQTVKAVNARREIDLAARALEAFDKRFLIGPPFGERRATQAHLQEELCDGVDVLYLVCPAAARARPEGMSLQIFLEKENGLPHALSVTELLELLRGCNIPPLVVLAAPHNLDADGKWRQSDPLGLLRKLVPGILEMGAEGVLAFNGAASWEMLGDFLRQFFQVLSVYGYMDQAVAVGRSHVRHQPDAWTPAIYLRERSSQAWRLSADISAEAAEAPVESPPDNYWLVSASPERFDWEQAFAAKSVLWDRSFGESAQSNLALARPGDVVLVYSADPVQRLIGIGRVESLPQSVSDWDGERLVLRFVLDVRLERGLGRNELVEIAPELEYLKHPLVSFTPVTTQQWAAIRQAITARDPHAILEI